MCTRFARTSLFEVLQHRFLFEGSYFEMTPDFNIAPTDPAYVIVQEEKKLLLKKMRFGLIPHWTQKRELAQSHLNARCETMDYLPAFQDSFKSRRCLVLTEGFFEWKKVGQERWPYRVMMKDQQPYAMAGLWDRWIREDGQAIDSFSIVTTEPNKLMAPIHNRMPVLLKPSDESVWIDPTVSGRKILQPLLNPYPSEEMTIIPVASIVNSPKNKSIECIQPFKSDLFQ